ncbi:UNVERIFIED_CONTAM: WAT1-related protein [Sesamum radiatum]|uniref:WAT1-related protein n=1 Tax=Sesamum radiatum TaxID=300843 RepID=A0AAW2KB61_SESRA
MGYWKDYTPTVLMIGSQFMYSAVTLVAKTALSQDMNSMAFVVYRQCTAFLLLAPFAFFPRKGANQCSLGWKSFCLIFLLSLIGVTLFQNLNFGGLKLTSSSAATAFSNLVPAITFIMAYTMGLEKLHLRSSRSVAKIIGTVLCVSGAVAIALLKGPKLLGNQFLPIKETILQRDPNQWLIGCLLLFGSACCWSLWLILQVHVTKSYPDHLSSTAWMCLFAAIQSGVLMFIFQPTIKAWKLNSSLDLFCSIFAKRGPLFSAMFQPLHTVIVTFFASIFQHEHLYMGSFIGSIGVIMGLYIVMWGKAKDHEHVKGETSPTTTLYTQVSDNRSCTIDLKEPLLPGK